MISQHLITHNGISHERSSQSTIKTQPDLKNIQVDSPFVIPESNSKVEQPTLELESKNSNKTEIPITQKLETATLFTGFGESIFTLLIASPFILLGFKKWLHK